MITPETVGLDVSRETCARLDLHLSLLRKWNPRINLVSRSTLDDAGLRHLRDSAQLVALCTEPVRHWVDLGSGGGFPGLVVAILLSEHNPECKVTLIESDTRKATFLRTVLRETGVTAEVIARRIEDTPPQDADVVSARALAPLPKLLALAHRHLCSKGTGLFPKGESWEKELRDAQMEWHFSCTPHTSTTNASAVVLEIGDLVHV